jgi:hypothetical protein
MGVGVGVGVAAGAGVDVGTGVGDCVGVGAGVGDVVAEGVAVGVGLGVWVPTGVGVGAGVAVGVGVTVGTGVGVGATDGVGVAPPPGTAAASRPCGDGAPWTNQSVALSFVSVPLPARPPGERSMLEPVGGAETAVPSTNELLASPHPTASIGVPPTARSTIAPPVAANPLEYVASAMDAYTPAELAIRTRLPGPRIVAVDQVALRVTVEPVAVA